MYIDVQMYIYVIAKYVYLESRETKINCNL